MVSIMHMNDSITSPFYALINTLYLFLAIKKGTIKVPFLHSEKWVIKRSFGSQNPSLLMPKSH